MSNYNITEKLVEEVIYDLLRKVKPWNAENAKKQIESYVRKVAYATIAKWTQGKTEDYLPVDGFIAVLGKRKTLARLKRGVEIAKKTNEYQARLWRKTPWAHF